MEMSGYVKRDVARWAFAALLVGAVEAVFAYVTFDALPLVQATTLPLSYVIFALAAGTIISVVSVGSGRDERRRAASVLAAFLSFLVFFDCVVILRRTPYFFQRVGQGVLLFAVCLALSLLVFALARRILRGRERPFPLFLAFVLVFHPAFLSLRYVNHYIYANSVFYAAPAILYNILIAVLFLPCILAAAKLFELRSVRSWLESGETGGRLLILLVLAIVTYMGGRMAHPSLPSDPRSPNIILIVMDTLRSDRLSCYGYERTTSPRLDFLASEGALFTHMIATAPWTLPTHGSMFTGLYPSSHGAHWEHMYLDGSVRTAAEVLAEAGYQTVGFSNNGIVSRATNLSQGFDGFYEMWKGETRFPTLKAELKDWFMLLAGREDAGAQRTNELIRGWLERHCTDDRPFFMFVNYLEVHLPYKPPVHFRKNFLPDTGLIGKMEKVSIQMLYRILLGEGKEKFPLSDEELGILSSLYDAEIAYLDTKIGELADYLRARGVLDSTCLILTSDHGENIGEHGLIDHQLVLYDTLLKVPLIVRYPALVAPGVRSDELVQSHDVFATILDAAGLESGAAGYPVQGRSLLGTLGSGGGRTSAYSEYQSPRSQFDRITRWAQAAGKVSDLSRLDRRLTSVRTDSLKYVWASDGNDELYRISADPGERENIADESAASACAMQKAIDDWKAGLPVIHEGSGEIPEMDKETEDLLKALGYID
jgi:arylsulfatase A-like enzyme